MKIRNIDIELIHNDNTSVYESLILDYIDSLNPKDVFYDLGACLGYFTIYASKKNLEVYSFEVDPKNYNGLVQNTEKNNVIVSHYNVAISNGESEEMELRIGQNYVGGHHKTIVTKNFAASDEIVKENYMRIKVPSFSLDQAIKKYRLPKPKNIKIDIDGSEYDFLIGVSDSLKHTDSMIIELYKKSVYHDDIMSIIKKNGFYIFKEELINQPGCSGCNDLYNVWFVK